MCIWAKSTSATNARQHHPSDTIQEVSKEVDVLLLLNTIDSVDVLLRMITANYSQSDLPRCAMSDIMEQEVLKVPVFGHRVVVRVVNITHETSDTKPHFRQRLAHSHLNCIGNSFTFILYRIQ